MSNLTKKSKFLSLVLRHKPEEIGISLDRNGWADINELITACNGKMTLEELMEIVLTDEKGRYTISEDGNKIRACQGHSLDVDLEYCLQIPPDVLYHGTSIKFYESIKKEGINKGKRTHVHLSSDLGTALNVGKRHGEPVIIYIDTKRMYLDTIRFFKSENNVWLVDHVDPKYFVKAIKTIEVTG